MIVANIFDFIDGKVAQQTNTVSRFGAFWDSTLDRFSDIALFLGLIYLYATLRRTDYVMVASLAMMFSIMTSYARARAESLIEKCKVGFMERPERIVLFMIGAFTNRMGAVLWVILILSIFTVADRIYYTYLVLNTRADSTRQESTHQGVHADVLLDRRADDAPLRLDGDRDPRVRVADAADLDQRSDGAGHGIVGVAGTVRFAGSQSSLVRRLPERDVVVQQAANDANRATRGSRSPSVATPASAAEDRRDPTRATSGRSADSSTARRPADGPADRASSAAPSRVYRSRAAHCSSDRMNRR